jgi:hypothetical protein
VFVLEASTIAETLTLLLGGCDNGKVFEPRMGDEVRSDLDRGAVTSEFEPERGRDDDEEDEGVKPNAL